MVHIDIVNLETTIATRKKPVVKKVLVAVDHFTRYVRAFVIPDCKAETIAQTLYDNYFSVFGFPCRLMSDKVHGVRGRDSDGTMRPPSGEEVAHIGVPPPGERHCREDTPDVNTNDREIRC